MDKQHDFNFDQRLVGDSSFIAESIGSQSASRNNVPFRRKRRRWVLKFFLASGLLLCLGASALALVDGAWRRVRRKVLSLLPEDMENKIYEAISHCRENPSICESKKEERDSYDIQHDKLENEEEYRAFLAGIGLKFITPEDVIRPHRNMCNGVRNQLPPKKYWARIEDTLKAADALREELGVPLKMINSAYRSPGYNSECNGAVANSYHTKNMALDLVFACPPKEAARAAKKLRAKGVFKGGIGVYPSFVHIDTRGRNADWGIPV